MRRSIRLPPPGIKRAFEAEGLRWQQKAALELMARSLWKPEFWRIKNEAEEILRKRANPTLRVDKNKIVYSLGGAVVSVRVKEYPDVEKLVNLESLRNLNNYYKALEAAFILNSWEGVKEFSEKIGRTLVNLLKRGEVLGIAHGRIYFWLDGNVYSVKLSRLRKILRKGGGE